MRELTIDNRPAHAAARHHARRCARRSPAPKAQRCSSTCPHTTAGLTINEHADPLVARDFEMALERIVPEGWGWQHIEEGEENAPSHPRASLMGPQVVIPLRDGELALGTWQGIFFCELDGPRTRSVYVTVLQ